MTTTTTKTPSTTTTLGPPTAAPTTPPRRSAAVDGAAQEISRRPAKFPGRGPLSRAIACRASPPKTALFPIRSVLLLALALLVAACAGAPARTTAVDDDQSPPTGDDDNDDNDNDDNNDNDNDDASPPAPDHVPFLDEQGRTLILRGANFMGMEWGWFHQAPSDFARMASWGFNVVRLPIAWSFLEPQEGVYDKSYLQTVVEPAVQYAYAAGLRVILDMHQWHWSPCCDSGGGNGAPAWTCVDPQPGNWEWVRQSGLFWDTPANLDHFVGAWQTVADYFAGDERIWAYDIFNEPTAGLRSLPRLCENQLFRPLYERFIATIRAASPQALIFTEPSIVNSDGFPFVMDPLPEGGLAYSPHLYPGLISFLPVGYWFGPGLIQANLRQFLADADARQEPMFVGETGVDSTAYRAEDYVRDATDALDEFAANYTWWTYWCDDNYTMGLLGSQCQEKPIFMHYLVRTFPRATAGVLRSFRFDVDTAAFTMTYDTLPTMPPAVEIFLPRDRLYPHGYTVDCSDPAGKWSSSFDAATQILTVVNDPATAHHTITVTALAY